MYLTDCVLLGYIIYNHMTQNYMIIDNIDCLKKGKYQSEAKGK